MREVVTLPSRKVEGIRGLYHDPSSDRWWVRFSYHGVDRQKSFTPKMLTFSGLERQAHAELALLKREVMRGMMPTEVQEKKVARDAAKEFQKALEKFYSARVTVKSFKRLAKYSEGFLLGGSETDAHNKGLLLTKLSEASEGIRTELYQKVGQVFRKFILCGVHTGIDPTALVKPPKKTSQKRTAFFTLQEMAAIEKALAKEKLEYQVFFKFCAITGQRPSDVHKISYDRFKGGHCHFFSEKTGRFQRVSHWIPAELQLDFKAIGGKFSLSLSQLGKILNRVITSLFPAKDGDEQRVLYTCRHSFLTALHELGYSIEDSAYFTHAGTTVTSDVYTHLPQEKADSMLKAYWDAYQRARLEICKAAI